LRPLETKVPVVISQRFLRVEIGSLGQSRVERLCATADAALVTHPEQLRVRIQERPPPKLWPA